MEITPEASQDLSKPTTPFQYLRLYLTGFAMGCADIVPGVSGGTMAFILGVYETLINAIKSADFTAAQLALKFDFKALFEYFPIRFLLALGLGILTAVFTLSSILHDLLSDEPTFIFAFFAGLILASILAIGAKVKWTTTAFVALAITAIFAFFLVGFDAEENEPVEHLIHAVEDDQEVEIAREDLIIQLTDAEYTNAEAEVDVFIAELQANSDTKEIQEAMTDAIESNYTAQNPVTLFFSGMAAICAMILPGISGSFILLILGQYEAVLGAVKNLDIISIGAIGVGAVIGIAAFSRIISWLLKNYENVTIAALTGFMVGSLRLIYTKAANGVDTVNPAGSLDGGQIALVVGLLVGGFVLVSLLDHMQSRQNPLFVLFGASKTSSAQPQAMD